MYRHQIPVWVCCVLGSLSAPVVAASAVQGRMTSDGITGRPEIVGAGWTHELIYVGALRWGFGAGCETSGGPPPGGYSISGLAEPPGFPAGTYALFALSFDKAPAFSYRTVDLPGGSPIVTGVELRTPAHYSVRYNNDYGEWGSAPWIWGTDFYQTFVATSPYVTRIATKLAGKAGDHEPMTLNFAVYKPNAHSPSAWPQISPTRSVWISGNTDPIIWIFHAVFRSKEVPLVPGQTYAARFWRDPSSTSQSFAIVARSDHRTGYPDGHLYAGNTAYTNLDAYAYISGGEPGTLVNHAPVADLSLAQLAGMSTRFGQTFIASGDGLAAVEIVYATGDVDPPSLPITFQVYESVGGAPIGTAKRCYGIPGYYQARAAAFWSRGDIPLVPGTKYYVEWTAPPPGVNTWRMNENLAGESYLDRVSQAPWDLLMAIAEYAPPSPTIGSDPAEFERSVQVGTNLPPDSFTISNGGGGTLNYTLATNAEWLSVDPTSGTSADGPDTVTINYNTASLAVGSYTGKVTINAPGATNSPATVTVYLQVEDAPRIVCPAALSAAGKVGADAPATSFTVQNSGYGTMHYTITAEPAWLSTEPVSDECGDEADTITVSFHTASLPPGTHTAAITITSPEAANSPQTIAVTLTQYAAPDFNTDGDVDLADFNLFQVCFNGPNAPWPPSCSVDADFDGDRDVDLADFLTFQACFNGPNRRPACQ